MGEFIGVLRRHQSAALTFNRVRILLRLTVTAMAKISRLKDQP
ncbi:hypothetical protein ABIA22_003361 [Sinorhizobium fredii]|nr:hypothetical protein AB395_00003987 [Sinorhizobium fredii CCBAU 45436]